MKVKAWHEKVIIPTYEVGEPDKNPIFLEKRVYQGSSGVVYPYPVIESISNEKTDKEYHAIFIENEYIKMIILPELGGRIQMAYDKIKQRHFIYYNQVIKPALVGLAGPWISGGIEFNWPQHHRPSTFMPVDSTIKENSDGSVTVWVNEIERMFHQKGMAGFTLYPGKAYIEIKGVVYNRTDMPQTFLWWANPAVAVNDYYQSVFPSDVNAVFDHGKRDVSSFPIATGTYYKMDYSAGVDISNYKNIKVPTSYMAVNSKYNFEGGYENDTNAGMLHVANHHISPGKKQWTWGNGDFGRAWDRNLTDEDGPYIELMAGVYTENQPDFTWLQPYEEKSFTQYFMPYRELGLVKNASKDILLNIEKNGHNSVLVKVFATSVHKVTITLNGKSILLSKEAIISPEEIFIKSFNIENENFNDLYLRISTENKILLEWSGESDEIKPIPNPAEAALLPEEIKTNQQLYLIGLHLEQYRHATYNPTDYYEEALRRDPLDVRCNNALGLWYIRKGKFKQAEDYLRIAVKVLQKMNPNPYDGEPIFNLGLSLKYQKRFNEAYDMFYKSCWNGAWQDAGYFECARISLMQNRLNDALEEIDKSLIRNWHNHKARALKVTILRKLNKEAEAKELINESLKIDMFNFGCLFEEYLLSVNIDSFLELIRDESHNYQEIALDYCAAGCWEEASKLLNISISTGAVSAITFYYLGYCLEQGNMQGVESAYKTASKTCSNYCFPNRIEDIIVLKSAMNYDANDSKAPFYLGNLYYDKRQYDLAIKYWERSYELDNCFATVSRNLALAYFNKLNKTEEAVTLMERAFELDTTDARIFMELDQLYKRIGRSSDERLTNLRRYPELIEKRDDLVLEEITLLNQSGEYEEAKRILDNHIFHPWEGGEGKVPSQYQYSRVQLAKRALSESNYSKAISLLEECLVYPHNLGEGKLYGAQESDFYYYLGCAYELNGALDKAKECWLKATLGPTEPVPALYYNDAKPGKIFYQGKALLKLGKQNEANSRFNKLKAYGKQHLYDKVKMDYFAVSLPDLLIWDNDLDIKNKIHCYFLIGLGEKGLGNDDKAVEFLQKAYDLDINNIDIFSELQDIQHSFMIFNYN